MMFDLGRRNNHVISHFTETKGNRVLRFFARKKLVRPPVIFAKLDLTPQKLDVKARGEKLAQVEALLFLSDEPLNPKKISALCGYSNAQEARKALKMLSSLLEENDSSFFLEEVAGGFQFLTKNAYHPWLSRLALPGGELNLSNAMKETLTIIAYRQPIPRAEIEQIRGVNSSEVLRHLLEKNLARIVGRDNTLGRPVLYGTSRKFLQTYGLKSLKDLPVSQELTKTKTNTPAQEITPSENPE